MSNENLKMNIFSSGESNVGHHFEEKLDVSKPCTQKLVGKIL